MDHLLGPAGICFKTINPITAPACKIPGVNMPTYTPPNSIFDGPITNLLSILCILIEIHSRGHAEGGNSFTWSCRRGKFIHVVMPKGEKKPERFQIWLFAGRFPSDGAESMAVKGLKYGFLCFLPAGGTFKPHARLMDKCVEKRRYR